MSATSGLRSEVVLIFGIIILLFSLFVLKALRYTESASQMINYWNVDHIYINGEDQIDSYEIKNLSFLDDNKLLLPKHKDHYAPPPLPYSRWSHKRKGLLDGIVIIDDTVQSIFSGTYEIEVYKKQEPRHIKLSSNNIVFYLTGIEQFSLQNQTVKTN